jgi:maleate cis-trans isomerase
VTTAGALIEAIRDLEAAPALEQALGKPVITSNSALMYVCLTRLGVSLDKIGAGGYLFTRRN